MKSVISFAGVWICVCSVCAAQAPQDPTWLRKELDASCRDHLVPAMAVAVVVGGKVAVASAVGYRKADNPVRVTRDDPFQLCSVTKSITATYIGKLVDEGKLRWDLTLAEMFPELLDEMRPAYRNVTVSQLLSHTDGLPYQPTTSQSVIDLRAGDLTGRRFEYTRAALRDEPLAAPGTKFIYGGGPILVANYAEKVEGNGYEALMGQHVFGPLGMRSAGFGCSALPGKVNGPWEHRIEFSAIHPVAPSLGLRHQARSPVGKNVNCSVIDLARFVALHLEGARGRSRFLRPETFAKLYEPQPPTKNTGLGFFRISLAKDGIQGDVLTHNGGNGVSCSVFMIAPLENVAACVLMNRGDQVACNVRDAWCRKLLVMARAGKFGASEE
jgi:CubicO group peptidase (beta-lactamase class C family)